MGRTPPLHLKDDVVEAKAPSHSTVVQPANCYILKLPVELLIEILKHQLRQGETIQMIGGKVSTRRKWEAEVQRLHDPHWKRPKYPKYYTLHLASRDLYLAAVETFWGGNLLSFSTMIELTKFLGVSTKLVQGRVKSIALFQDAQNLQSQFHPCPVVTGDFLPPRLLSLHSLSAFPSLQSLHITMTAFSGVCLFSNLDV